jgi:hypothetical protein
VISFAEEFREKGKIGKKWRRIKKLATFFNFLFGCAWFCRIVQYVKTAETFSRQIQSWALASMPFRLMPPASEFQHPVSHSPVPD